MKLGTLPAAELRARLGRGLVLKTGPFRIQVASRTEEVFQGLHRLYDEFEFHDDGFVDYFVRVDRVRGPRGHWRPQVSFWFDGMEPFKPLPADHAFASLEWGLNWCIAGHAHYYLSLHAAALERNGRAVILPGDPGAGKSTLTAALALSGFRLLSDEMSLIDRADGLLVPLARPVNLKNDSIAIIAAFRPEAVFGPTAHETHKGTVAHLKPPVDSVRRMDEKARPAFLVFPRWQAGAPARLTPRPRADAFMHAATHAFSYELLGPLGYELNAALIDGCECFDFTYSKLDDAIAVFEDLLR